MSRITVSGHRGNPETATENTRAAFESALQIPVDYIETDVRLSADGHVVVAHDPDFSRLGGPGLRIRSLRRPDLETLRLGRDGEDSPLFMDEALKLFPGARFNVDLKDRSPRLATAWANLLKTAGAGERCRTTSFYDGVLRRFGKSAPGFPIGVSRGRFVCLLLAALFGQSRSPRNGESVLQIPETFGPFRLLNPGRIKLWHRFGWKVEVWTIDNEEDMRRLIDWGVDGIITNRPSLLRKLL